MTERGNVLRRALKHPGVVAARWDSEERTLYLYCNMGLPEERLGDVRNAVAYHLKPELKYQMSHMPLDCALGYGLRAVPWPPSAAEGAVMILDESEDVVVKQEGVDYGEPERQGGPLGRSGRGPHR